jgi:hypothetical protein
MIVVAVAWSGERGMCRQVGVGMVPQQSRSEVFTRIAALQIVEDIVGFRGSHRGNTGSSPVGRVPPGRVQNGSNIWGQTAVNIDDREWGSGCHGTS